MMAVPKISERAVSSIRPQAKIIPFHRHAPISYPIGKAWHCVYTNIKCERRAALGINALGLETYLPEEVRHRKHRGRQTKVRLPVFTRYLFVRFDPNIDEYGAIRLVDGVECLLENNDIPVRIPDEAIDVIKRHEANGVFDKTGKPAFDVGERVRVAEGEFSGIIGKVISASPKKRIRVLIEFMGRLVPTLFRLADLERVR